MDPLHYRAFTTPSGGGNPAGVVLDASGMTDTEMQEIATDLGYSETAFLVPVDGADYRIRYFSPLAEVDFCGHATVASAVALADRDGTASDYVFRANVGPIPVQVRSTERGYAATLQSVVPSASDLEELPELLRVLGWDRDDLAPDLPPGVAFAGLSHPVLWAATRARLADLAYDFAAMKDLMITRGWGTVSLLYRASPDVIHARNAFAVGGVVEDPATGAAAAALGGFLRAHGLLPADGRFTVMQGEDMGQPCRIEVDASGEGGVRVSGTAAPIPRA
ncbi:PhzF family phenazine biosynthesis protein [Microbacterium sp. TNHR37B]|uniref:PhzF family phenazine biosynthesis protein n=1 Tax=Microbacterium sp. TNHR37B TaxID=1775956 RepID=UPI0007B2DF39|nr:PhzF family phenazine biosynthesis protein [Microbacterium sp. TNHR37B]KZE89411.1 putative isomerase YddE [Microbacterium sp. TNHR37B]